MSRNTMRDRKVELGSLSLLLVDDDPLMQSAMVQGLERLGFDVIVTGSAAGALSVVADPTLRVDVMILDIVLPDSWGGQVAMESSFFRPELPVLYISGQDREDAVLQASSGQEEMNFLPKPFSALELVDKLREVMGRVAEA